MVPEVSMAAGVGSCVVVFIAAILCTALIVRQEKRR